MLSGLGMQYLYLNLICVTTNITFTSTHTSFKVQNETAAWGGILVRCMNTLDSIANFKVRALFSRVLVKRSRHTLRVYRVYWFWMQSRFKQTLLLTVPIFYLTYDLPGL